MPLREYQFHSRYPYHPRASEDKWDIDGHHCLESHGIPGNTRSSKWVQIQQQLLPKESTWATLGVAK
jgi:hypothetical protein